MNKKVVTNEIYDNHDLLATARWGDAEYMAQHYPYKKGSFWLGRNPHDPHQSLGFDGDGHIFLAAGSRSGKGRSIIVNNLIKWPGSIVSIDPKGLNATITAARRGQGDKCCDGMGQDVYVLDPMNCADVPDELRAHYNLLDALDPDDGNLSAYADMIADAICVIPEGSDAAEWALEGKEFVSIIIQWVVCAPHIADKDRNLLTVRNLIMEGEYQRSERLK
jgi:type IV secretory pathway TraG/TraD family ATPase VirD4